MKKVTSSCCGHLHEVFHCIKREDTKWRPRMQRCSGKPRHWNQDQPASHPTPFSRYGTCAKYREPFTFQKKIATRLLGKPQQGFNKPSVPCSDYL